MKYFLRKCPRSIILDLDNTLYDYNTAHRAAFLALQKLSAKKLSLSPSDFRRRYERARLLVKSRLDTTAAAHSRLLYIKALLDGLFINNPGLTLELESVYWKEFFKRMRLYQDVSPFLSFMKREGVRMIILSDLTLRIQLKKIIHLKVGKFFSFILTSEETGVEKPALKNFRAACRKFKIRPSDVWVVGDDKSRDIKGAVHLGAKPILINRKSSRRMRFHKTYLEVNSFSALSELYRRLRS